MDDLTAGLSALAESQESYETAHRYYKGSVAEVFASPRMRRAIRNSGVDVRFNFAKKPVDAVADRLELAAITGPDEASTQALQEIWETNALGLEAPNIMRRACEYGDAYVLVWPADPEVSRVNVFYNSPETCRVIYDQENPLEKSFAIKRWADRCDLYYPDRIEKYVLRKGAKPNEASSWEQYTDDEGDEWPYENPYGEVPVFHFRTDRPYGEPLHFGFYGPQDAINKLIISHLSSVDYQAGPQRYAMLEADADTAEAEDDDFEFGADDDEGAGSPEATSNLSSAPGSVWWLRDVKGVGQFESAKPEVFTDPMLTYLRMGADITSTPLHRIDPTTVVPSGEAFRACEGPFVKKVNGLQRSFGATWEEAFTFALRVYQGAEVKTQVDVRWAPAQTVEDKDFWDTAKLKIEAGVPPYQVLLEAGYTAEQMAAWGVEPNESVPASQGE
ncbi:phage portal protein [Pseudonocardia lutea]|uniref:Phage portal protein n=1 Tax=Pseudonocardia lutea TaxID=2172015 RepID=A0ABW1I333_9PSEU